MRILREQSAGLVIDIQEKLFPFISGNDALTSSSVILVKGLHALKIPIITTVQYTKGLGPTIRPLRELLPDEETIEKLSFSCCDDPVFMKKLESIQKRFIIISGIESHVCVLQTVTDLLEKGYVPVVAEDCVSSRKLNDKNMAIARMRRQGAIITTYESVLFELLRYSGTEEFKAISRLVK
ncbi:MAG: hydrolase [Bacteroidales bacterium]|nr:hydrolase [Bacteroidales bacterium]